MTPLFAIVSLMSCVAAYAWIAFWRFDAIDMRELADYERRLETHGVGRVVGVIASVVAWGSAIFALGRRGDDSLQEFVWAGTAVVLLSLWTFRCFLPARCSDCAGPVRRFRKREQAAIPRIVHLTVCDRCKTCREQLVIGVGGG